MCPSGVNLSLEAHFLFLACLCHNRSPCVYLSYTSSSVLCHVYILPRCSKPAVQSLQCCAHANPTLPLPRTHRPAPFPHRAITSFCETASGTHECAFRVSPAWRGVADQSDLTWFDLGCAPPAPSAVAGQLRARLVHTAARAEGHQGLPPGPVQPSAPGPLLSALSDSSVQMFRPNGTFDADSFGFYFLIFNAIHYAINFANILLHKI